MPHTMTRSGAKTLTLAAQIGVGVCALAILAMIFLGMPGGETPQIETVSLGDPRFIPDTVQELGGSGTSAQDEPEPVDFGGIAARLGEVENAPEIEVATGPDPDEVDGGGTIEIPVAPPSDEVKYLGMVSEPNRTLALLSINGRQRILPADRSITIPANEDLGLDAGSLKIVSIEDGELEIELRGARQTVSRGTRSSSAVTQVAADAIERTAAASRQAAAGEEAPRQTADGERPDYDRIRREAIERARERGQIDPERAEMLLNRSRDRGRGRGIRGNGNGGGDEGGRQN